MRKLYYSSVPSLACQDAVGKVVRQEWGRLLLLCWYSRSCREGRPAPI